MEKKVDKMEHSIGSIIAKLDAVLVKTGVMQEGEGQCQYYSSDLYYPPPSESMTGEGAGNATFMLDMTEHGQVEDFVPGDGTDGNATFV